MSIHQDLQNILWQMIQLKDEMKEARDQEQAQFQETITLAQDTTKRLIAHFSEFERILNKISQEIAPFFVKTTEKAAQDMANSAAQEFEKILEEKAHKSLASLQETSQKIEASLKAAAHLQASRQFLISIAFCCGVFLTCIVLFLILTSSRKDEPQRYQESILSETRPPSSRPSLTRKNERNKKS